MSDLIEKKKTIHGQVYQLIKNRIIDGTYPPRERLYEAKLAREFGVSRSPIREAIRMLENEGLLLQDIHSRIFVYHPSSNDVEQIYQCRQVLESLAVSLTAKLASPTELNYIMNLALQAENTIDDTSLESKRSLVQLNTLFHPALLLLKDPSLTH